MNMFLKHVDVWTSAKLVLLNIYTGLGIVWPSNCVSILLYSHNFGYLLAFSSLCCSVSGTSYLLVLSWCHQSSSRLKRITYCSLGFQEILSSSHFTCFWPCLKFFFVLTHLMLSSLDLSQHTVCHMCPLNTERVIYISTQNVSYLYQHKVCCMLLRDNMPSKWKTAVFFSIFVGICEQFLTLK